MVFYQGIFARQQRALSNLACRDVLGFSSSVSFSCVLAPHLNCVNCKLLDQFFCLDLRFSDRERKDRAHSR